MSQEDNHMVERRAWEEFRNSGLLWFVNTILHLFGWAIVIERQKEGPQDSWVGYPARVLFRGFSLQASDDGYVKLTSYLKQHAPIMYQDLISTGLIKDDENLLTDKN